MTPRPVRLTPSEARMACLVGAERMISSLMEGNRSRPGIRAEVAWGIHIEGAGAELALAKVLGWFWDGSVGVFHHQADVRHIHVRQTSWAGGHLLIRPSRDVPGIYALVTGTLPRYSVRGWTTWPGCPAVERSPDPGQPPVLMVAQADLKDLAQLDGQAAAAYGGR